MFKPVHGIDGTLLTGVSASATTLIVDDTTLCLLKRRLTSADYTYLLLRQNYDYEIVKTTGIVGNGVAVLRAQDGTSPLIFTAGAQVEFVLGAAAIQDVITDRGLAEVVLDGDGIVTVTRNSANNYTISAPEITITSDSPNVLVSGDFPNFVLSAPTLVNCCD